MRDGKIPDSAAAPLSVRQELDALPCSAPAFVVEQWPRMGNRAADLAAHACLAEWLAFAWGVDFGPPVITRQLPRNGMSRDGLNRMASKLETATNCGFLVSLSLERQVAAAFSPRWVVKHAHACSRRHMDNARLSLRLAFGKWSKLQHPSVRRFRYGFCA